LTTMSHHDVVDAASALVRSVQAGREARTRVLEDARVARRDSRHLRERTRDTLETNLRQGWQLWSAGVVSQPPGLLPRSWSEGTASADLVGDAIAACTDAYVSASGFCVSSAADERRDLKRAFALIAAAAAVAQARLADELDSDALDALSFCVRVIDTRESALTDHLDSPEAVVAASAARRCVATSRRTLASLYGVKH
jgi:hypothetical protein